MSMNMKELYENEANRMKCQAEAIDKLAEAEDLMWSEKRPLGSSFRSTVLWTGVHSHGGVSSDTYGVYIIFRRSVPIYVGEGVLTQRIGLAGYHYKTLLGKGVTPDPSKDSFMTKAYNDEPETKDYEVSYFVIDTGNKQSNKSTGLMIESFIVDEFNLEETGYNGKGQVDPFVIYDAPKTQSKTKTTRAKNTSEEDIVQHILDFKKSDMNKTQFALDNNIGKSTFIRWTNDPRFKNVG